MPAQAPQAALGAPGPQPLCPSWDGAFPGTPGVWKLTAHLLKTQTQTHILRICQRPRTLQKHRSGAWGTWREPWAPRAWGVGVGCGHYKDTPSRAQPLSCTEAQGCGQGVPLHL